MLLTPQFQGTCNRTLSVPLLFLLSGCVSESAQGDKTRFAYAAWLPLLVLAGGISAGTVGGFLRRKSAWARWGLMIGGPLVAILFAATMFGEQVVVDSQGFRFASGNWNISANRSVSFDEVQVVRIITEHTGGRLGRYIDILLFDGP